MDSQDSTNPYLAFYGEHHISPVHQDLSNFRSHLERREKLYRMLGLPLPVFSSKRILEVGPGGGYNTLTLFIWGGNVDFVEPNPAAREDLKQLLAKYRIAGPRWNLYPGVIEEYAPEFFYDIVIAEGFIPGLYDRRQVIAKLKRLARPGGVVVVTCFDELSTFFEVLKRLVAHCLIRNVTDYQEKVTILCRAFESHLKTLRYVSRPIADWVQDMFLNPAFHGRIFNIADCIEEFGAEFDFLGGSPAMFTNYQWYKDSDFDNRANIINQYKMKRHTLLFWDMPESIRPAADNDLLSGLASRIRSLAGELEQDWQTGINIISQRMIPLLKEFNSFAGDLDGRVSGTINEVIELLTTSNLTAAKVARAGYFSKAFGRGQQYISLVKKTVYDPVEL